MKTSIHIRSVRLAVRRAARARGRRSLRPRRGIALFLSLFFVAGIGALALSAIYLTANATLLSKTYEHEDDLKYAAEAALAIGKSNLNYNPAALPSTSYVTMMSGKQLTTADGQKLAGITVNLYAGPSGSTSGQFGRFATLVAQAVDNNGIGFVRRLELTQESFAKFAYWTNNEGNNILFGNGDAIWGPVWSNDTIQINNTGASFHDEVGTAGIITGTQYGTFYRGYSIKQKPIPLPSTSMLATLPPLATSGGMNFTSATTSGIQSVLDRVEFLGIDLDGDGVSTGDAEGFFRVYEANSGQARWLRGDWSSSSSDSSTVSNFLTCGDWHHVAGDTAQKFFPAAVHVHAHKHNGSDTTTWFDSVVAGGKSGGITSTNITAVQTESDSGIVAIMGHAGARCYLGGDPHLVAVARTTTLGYSAAAIHKGGDDTTFTPTDQYGHWIKVTDSPIDTLAHKRPADAKYLYSLYRGFNTNTKGVMYFNGSVGVSGTLRGQITLYALHSIAILDDLKYATDPGSVEGALCPNILGLISGDSITVADNGLNSTHFIHTTSPKLEKSLDDTPDMYVQAVMMALHNSFGVENYAAGSTDALTCGTTTVGRGCLYLTGGVIQQTRGAVGTSNGTGYVKRYSYDMCAISNPPPYFPTTGRFQDNRYYELDPARFDPATYYKSLVPKS